jgi:hypothetical protein
MEPVFEAIERAVIAVFGRKHENLMVYRIDQFAGEVPPEEVEKRAISEADLVIANLAGSNRSLYYELGMTEGLKKRLLLLVGSPEEIPYNLKSYPV